MSLLDFVDNHPLLSIFMVAWLGGLVWWLACHIQPPKDPPPSGKADSSFGLSLSLGGAR